MRSVRTSISRETSTPTPRNAHPTYTLNREEPAYQVQTGSLQTSAPTAL